MDTPSDIGKLLEEEALLGFPNVNFSKTCGLILEGAVKIGKAHRGALFLLGKKQKLSSQSFHQCSEGKIKERALERSQLLVDRDEEVSHLAGEEEEPWLTLRLRRRGWSDIQRKEDKNSDRRKFSALRETILEESPSSIGVIYLERSPDERFFTPREINFLESYLHYASMQLLQARVYDHATLDEESRLFARPQFETLLLGEMRGARNYSYPLAVLIGEILNWEEQIDPSRGKGARELWSELGQRIKAIIRIDDRAIRFGQRQFALLLPGVSNNEVEPAVTRIFGELKKDKLKSTGKRVELTAGVALFPKHGDTPEELMRKAGQSLSLAKFNQESHSLWNPHSTRLLDILTGDPVQDHRHVLMLLETLMAMHSTLDYKELLYTIVGTLLEMTDADRGILITYYKKGLKQVVAQDREGREIIPHQYLEEIVDRVKETEKPYIENRLRGESPAIQKKIREWGIKAVICLPLVIRSKVIGVVYLDSQRQREDFSLSDTVFYQALAREIGIVLEHSRLYEENLWAKRKVEELNRKLEEKVRQQATELEEFKVSLDANLKDLKSKYNYSNIIGKSKALQTVFSLLDQVTASDVPLLITGESGTGKELVAKAVHYNSPRKDRRFVSVNCAALPEDLLESELFGYEKGAFTGASSQKKGLFALADGGTLFLDEVGDMSLKMQKKLLRALQEGEIRPLGGKETIPVNVRILSATNRNLQTLMEEGEFRDDLYYRLNVIQVKLPPLRERKEDIFLLARKFLKDFAKENNIQIPRLSPEASQKLLSYHWPGNIRELKNVMERAALISSDELIESEEIVFDFPTGSDQKGEKGLRSSLGDDFEKGDITSPAVLRDRVYDLVEKYLQKEGVPSREEENDREVPLDLTYHEARDSFTSQYLEGLLEKYHYNISRASSQADVSRSYFYKLLDKHGIELPSDS